MIVMILSSCSSVKEKDSEELEEVEDENLTLDTDGQDQLDDDSELDDYSYELGSEIEIESLEIIGFRSNDDGFRVLPTNIRVMGKTSNYLLGVGKVAGDGGQSLYKSRNGGNTWIQVKKFKRKIKGIHTNGRESIFVAIGGDRWSEDPKTELLKAENVESEFKKVLDIKSGVVLNWNMASDSEGYMFLSEYGNKDIEDNPRRIYRSKDYGTTWEVVYEPSPQKGYHNHVIHIDKYNLNNIYQIVGDDDKKLIISKDRGDTWDVKDTDYHPTSVVQIQNYLIYGLDAVPFSGFKTLDTETDEIVRNYRLKKPRYGSIYDMVLVGETIYAGALSYYYNDWAGSILISTNYGESWNTLAEVNRPEDLGVSFDNFIEFNGDVYIGGVYPVILNGEETTFHGTIKYKVKK